MLDTQYGSSSGNYWPTSINGTDVLATMFSDAGFEVSTRRVLITSSMENVQTIVWFPDDIHAPDEEVCAWFDEWLASGTDRTLVYVGRGYDAEPVYFAKMLPLVAKDQKKSYLEQLAGRSTIRPPKVPASDMKCEWFSIDGPEPTLATSLRGPWSTDVDINKADLYLSDQFQTQLPSRTLLRKQRTACHIDSRPGLGERQTDRDLQRLVSAQYAAGQSRESQTGRQTC